MMQYMSKWVQDLGHKQHEVLSRLSKEQVRNHKNIRLGGEGGTPAAQGSYAYNAAHNVQHQIGGYVNTIPGVQQVQGVFHSVSAFGQARDGPPVGPGGQGAGSGYHPPAGPPPGSAPAPMPVSALGEAASYYGGGSGSSQPPPPPVRHDTRPGFPDAAPSGAPSFPSYGGGYGDNSPHAQQGYAPSYASPPPGGPPSFPNASSYPGQGQQQHHHHGPPPGPPGGGYGMPSYGGGPPAFPGADVPGGPPGFPNAGAYAPPPGPPPPFPGGGGGSYYGGYQSPPGPPPGGW